MSVYYQKVPHTNDTPAWSAGGFIFHFLLTFCCFTGYISPFLHSPWIKDCPVLCFEQRRRPKIEAAGRKPHEPADYGGYATQVGRLNSNV